ncbi:MarR family winged helix-turn-helix transcriptional regulator [Leptospira mayottensis]|uniref:MarR family protein n=2 Tax=Leptospira mayottensis TaxID=1137606 RepID=A0AA87MNX8_9LEPT|nr:MarR family transcriptional regulator [Leptospira mayottensis]AXR59721.1 MarR family transcriptional regulator [Leptospira mayottensis]AXR66010.1 MarR family transcriptional regulator [Leptospira mayottensis]AZQ00959.1 MarR family transcriptional regulator [Leptospira mayottensis 200901116]EKS00597.1 MarR family protein [Leptospira mayottensis 200901122]TGN01780.1 MarR family transcriptional regulator [Leptospira mayottensis]
MKDFQIENTLGYRINRGAIVMKLELQERFKSAGFSITPEEWVILNRLWESDGMNQNEISQKTIKDKTTVTRFLNGMEKDGLIRRVVAEEDRRSRLIFLTEKGEKLKEELIQIAKSLLNDASMEINKEHLTITINVLAQIERNIVNLKAK